MAAPRSLNIINARENNLKSVSPQIPHDTFTVVTGLSGSGKSSLAFDTVYAEGQRRYIETFSPYTRQFFDKVKKPEVDLIENVRPAVAIQQRTRVTSSRSTVGTMTNLNDYLKLLWPALSQATCEHCSIPLQRWDAPTLAAHLTKSHALRGHPLTLIVAPITLPKKKSEREEKIARIIELGMSRYLNPESCTVAQLEDGQPVTDSRGRLLIVLDRLKGESSRLKQLKESIEQAFSLTAQEPRGSSCVEILPTRKQRTFAIVTQGPIQETHKPARYDCREYYTAYLCPSTGTRIAPPTPSLFSFNHPIGACPSCKGFGRILKIDATLIVPDPTKTIREKAIQCWASDGTKAEFKELLAFCDKEHISVETPWRELPEESRNRLFESKSKSFWGLNHWFAWLEKKAYKMHVRVYLSKYRSQFVCPECNGTRLKSAARAYRVEGRTLPDAWNMPIAELLTWLEHIAATREANDQLPRDLRELLHAIIIRLRFLNDLGLPYLTLDRQARTLSGGETQRVNLAAALGSDLVSTHFVLDEPSVGLHARDTERLTRALRTLQQRGNSLLVVEHDMDCINEADYIIEMGPGAGSSGGEVTYCGSFDGWSGIAINPELAVTQKSITLAEKSHGAITIHAATGRNLKGFNTKIPLGTFTCFTGVSGSGKSTLVHEVIKKSYDEYLLGMSPEKPLVSGFEAIEQILIVDQSPLAKSPRGNIGTYSGIWELIRNLLADTPSAEERGFTKSTFSFNVDGGRCPECKGAGFIREDMQFLSDVYIPCDVCLGKRFKEQVLDVTLSGKNVHEFLTMSLTECVSFFEAYPAITRPAQTLCDLGLGHLTLGHPLSELSGGEAQRLKLIPFIEQSSAGRSLLIFDEPTTGLHHYDVLKLIGLLRTLVTHGHTVLCVEHNLTLIAAADWLIDLGPEGGAEGGNLLFEGTPLELTQLPSKHPSYTATHLRRYLTPTKRDRKRNDPAATAPTERSLIIKGAREHNLKNLDVAIPLEELVAITGVSGSGKSSLAKDIIYAEGQRRYLDCLSPYARQFIKELKRPEIDHIENIAPTICVYQHTFQPSRLSTIGTMSEIYNFLRLLYAKIGIQHCPEHPEETISPLAPEEMAQQIKSLQTKSVRILAPIIKKKKGTHRAILERALQLEVTQVRIDGVFFNPTTIIGGSGLEKTKPHTIEYVVAKGNPKTLPADLLQEAIRSALSLGSGALVVVTDTDEFVLSTERTCPVCKRGFLRPDPEDLSFSSRRGACKKCSGAGSLSSGKVCPSCNGDRLNPQGLALKLAGKNIGELSRETPQALKAIVNTLACSERHRKIATPVLRELNARTDALCSVGLEYLPLSRDCATLSGGELQRLRLAAAMGSPLTGVIYIFDEPSAGLHPQDNQRVLTQLRDLQQRGNSVFVIEHDPESINACDYIVDIGPGGGKHGGTLLYSGLREPYARSGETPTARALRNTPVIAATHAPFPEKLTIRGANKHNLKDLSLTVPLGALTVIAGVSGAGKSSLLRGVIAATLGENPDELRSWKSDRVTIESSCDINRILEVDQKPIGSTSRSTPASYLGIWDEIRHLYANTLEAKARGWTNSFFSFNSGKGRCPACKGQGQITLEMSFLPDAHIPCETCGNTRFTEDARSVRYLDHSIDAVLRATFEEAMTLFVNHRKIYHPLRQACDLGLGYLSLGQPSSTLSGGESQRIKLVSELGLTRRGHTLYLLDEPTTGLHKADVAKLMQALKLLVAQGNTVMLIEHDSDVIAQADHIIELGPGPGEAGGEVLFTGAAHELLRSDTPWGRELKRTVVGTDVAA
jgi:excinuclease ABC subunit A